jgi:alkyl hydroperoxide reductase subunit AhpF
MTVWAAVEGQQEVRAEAVFIMIGAQPHTDWLARSSASTRTASC